MKPAGHWDKEKHRRTKKINGVTHRVTCGQLGLPRHLWTDEGSEKAAKEYFKRIEEQSIVERYAETHPELKGLAIIADALDKDGKPHDAIDKHLEEASARPSGATREDTELEREIRAKYEQLFGVDLSHVPQMILTHQVFRENLAVVKRRDAVEVDRSLPNLVDAYLRQRRESEDKGLKEASTTDFNKYMLRHLTDFFGKISVDALATFEQWHRWGEHCQSQERSGEWANKSARSILTGSRSFMDWLVKKEYIARTPNNFDDYAIAKEEIEPEIFTEAELKLILSKAEDELRLWVLLALNTGANQIDIANLTYAKKASDLGFFGNQIRRKRVKTKRIKKVPVVRYVLWPETLALIEKYKANGEHVLLTSEGNVLVDRKRKANGKRPNNDAIGQRFGRFVERLELPKGKTFKTLRATAASELGNSEYRVFGGLFLGHAPTTVFEKNYLQEDCRLLNEGVAWLGKRFGLT